MFRRIVISCLVVAGLAAIDLLVGTGGFGIAPEAVMWKLRVPRMLSAALAGAALALSGLQMQGIFRNPLADPHIMGVSSGAGLGAAVFTVLCAGTAWSFAGVALGAFLGAAGASLLIIGVSGKIRSVTVLLLFGVMLGYVLSALSSLLQYIADEESLKIFYSWMAGSFSGNGMSEILVTGGALIVGVVLAGINAGGMDAVLFGDDYALMTGVKVRRVRFLAMAGSCLMTGAAVAFCGPVGFVGIVAPHAARWVMGSSVHRKVLWMTLFCGAGMTLAADIISQAWVMPLPVGSMMAVIGIPLIFIILWRKV